ncbi:hypothetical protein D8674_035281 [Pyrus ussuriensis x Pyrus communis]|uniref:Uncharacterized protein n=1 Tax=Pyrus ussuriensis x Pyrus communis TaxID=2448454 RepID=A0A5N5GBX1_9ROSA|nr:hypothetical protein D8674_035281 [Pyrus ussuriensis x Pyrus communis]
MDTGETGLGAGASWAAERTAKRTAVRATMEDAFAIVDRVCTSVCFREFMVFEDAKRLKAQLKEAWVDFSKSTLGVPSSAYVSKVMPRDMLKWYAPSLAKQQRFT